MEEDEDDAVGDATIDDEGVDVVVVVVIVVVVVVVVVVDVVNVSSVPSRSIQQRTYHVCASMPSRSSTSSVRYGVHPFPPSELTCTQAS